MKNHVSFRAKTWYLHSHVKITCYLHMWRYHSCYGYMSISRLLQQKLKGLVFIGVYIMKRILHGRLKIRNFSSRVKKYSTRSLRSLVKYYSTLEEKFRISARPCNILYRIIIVCITNHMYAVRTYFYWARDSSEIIRDYICVLHMRFLIKTKWWTRRNFVKMATD